MAGDRLIRSAALFGYLSGALVLAGIPLAIASAVRGQPFQTLDQVVTLLAFLSMLPLAAALQRIAPHRARALALLAFAVGAAGMLAAAVIQLLLVLRALFLAERYAPTLVAFGAIGIWLIVANQLAARRIASAWTVWLGSAVGAVFVLANVAVWLGAAPAREVEPAEATPLILLIVAVLTLAANLGYPIWAISIGRRIAAGLEA